MYCPKCATVNGEEAKFCRGCGTDLSLVSAALTGRLPELLEEESDKKGRRGRRRKKLPTLEKGIETLALGVGFIFVALAVARFAPAGRLWWFWLLIPAFSMIGSGIGEILRARQKPTQPSVAPPQAKPQVAPPPPRELPRRNTAELVPPPSVTEHTTRHLEPVPERSRKTE